MGWATLLLTLAATSAWAAVTVLVSDTPQTYTLANMLTLDSTVFSSFAASWTWFLCFWIKLDSRDPPDANFMSFETGMLGDIPYSQAGQLVSYLFGPCNGVTGINTDWLHFTYYSDGILTHLVISKRDGSSCDLGGGKLQFDPSTATLMFPTPYFSPNAVSLSVMDLRFDPVTAITSADVALLTCATSGMSACPCSPTCATCSSYDAEGCKTCLSNASIPAVATVGPCSCPATHFPNPDSTNCSPCHVSCGLCTGPATTDCYKCKGHGRLDNGTCICDSPNVFNAVTGACDPCHLSCASCTGPGMNQCTSCGSAGATLPVNPGPCVCGAGQVVDPTSGKCCPSTCPESCVPGLGCFLNGAYLFLATPPPSGLPYTTPVNNLICFRFPIPTDCALSSLEAITGPLGADPSTWSLTAEQCYRHLDSEYPFLEAAYNKLFGSVPLPTPVGYLETDQTALIKRFFMVWTIQFNYAEISTNQEWIDFRAFLNSISDWTKVAAYKSPPKYWTGKEEKKFPKALEDWIAGGGKDYNVLNTWNSLPPGCSDPACDMTTGAGCCAATITMTGPCCQAYYP